MGKTVSLVAVLLVGAFFLGRWSITSTYEEWSVSMGLDDFRPHEDDKIYRLPPKARAGVIEVSRNWHRALTRAMDNMAAYEEQRDDCREELKWAKTARTDKKR